MRGHGVVILEGKYLDPLQLLKRKEDSTMATVYDPAKHYEIKVWDVEFRRDPVRTLMARIYQPQGSGPFPALLDLHGGAWNNQDRTANAPMDESLAASGLLVVAIDLRRAPEAPYPACGAGRELRCSLAQSEGARMERRSCNRCRAGELQRRSRNRLCAMRPHDPRYNAHPLPEAPSVDATLPYVVARSPVSDPFARYQQAEKRQWAEMIQNSKTYFDPWETIYEGNPQLILERHEPVTLPPLYVLQGELDDNVLPSFQEKFAATYRAAGGECELEIFKDCEPLGRQPGPADRPGERKNQGLHRAPA